MFVFDRAQLEALPLEPAALDRPTEPVTGGSHALLMAPLPALRMHSQPTLSPMSTYNVLPPEIGTLTIVV